MPRPLAVPHPQEATHVPEGALDRAAAAMAAMSADLEDWFTDELARLARARVAWRRSPGAVATLPLKSCAHDLKGLGATYGYPLVGRVAGSLERLLDAPEPASALVEAHLDAIAAIVREAAGAPDHPVGAALALALEHAEALGARPG